MIHSRIKRLHTKEDNTTRQKTIRSQNTISEKDFRDLRKISRHRKYDWYKSPEGQTVSKSFEGQCCSLPKKRTREAVLQSRLFKDQTHQEG